MLQVHSTLETGQDEETNTCTRVNTEVLFARYQETWQRERVSHLYSPWVSNRDRDSRDRTIPSERCIQRM